MIFWKRKAGDRMNYPRRGSAGFGLIGIMIVLVIAVLALYYIRDAHLKKQGAAAPSYDKAYDDAGKQIEKIKALRSGQ